MDTATSRLKDIVESYRDANKGTDPLASLSIGTDGLWHARLSVPPAGPLGGREYTSARETPEDAVDALRARVETAL